MGKNSNISWTEATWNPWIGCLKVSKGCENCYAHRILGQKGRLITKSIKSFKAPLNWKVGKIIFTCSMSDFFIEQGDDEWRDEAWDVIKNTPWHTYLILTKRTERIKFCLPKDWSSENYSHVWLGVSCENEKHLDRIHILGDIPCQLRWVSFEPLLSEIYLTDKEISIIDGAIIGGESGYNNNFRKTEISWFLSLMYQLRSSEIPIFFKQFGSWYQKNKFLLKDWKGEKYCSHFPEGFKIREFPNLNSLKNE